MLLCTADPREYLVKLLKQRPIDLLTRFKEFDSETCCVDVVGCLGDISTLGVGGADIFSGFPTIQIRERHP